jgi:hypothetical protein
MIQTIIGSETAAAGDADQQQEYDVQDRMLFSLIADCRWHLVHGSHLKGHESTKENVRRWAPIDLSVSVAQRHQQFEPPGKAARVLKSCSHVV